jgi:TetR/AcrR family tetracycline transcriptional repressor
LARPKVPLISKREVLVVALRIIDEDGIDALNIRRLAGEFKVNGASLYHHFKNKDEIIAGAAELAFDELRAPKGRSDNWREWLPRNAKQYRKVLVAHPDLTMIMARRGRFGIGLRRIDETFRRLEEEGVPMEAGLAMFEAVETFAIGSALSEAYQKQNQDHSFDLENLYPTMQRVFSHRSLSYEAEFDIGCLGLIDAIAAEFGLPLPPAVKRPSAKGR